METVKTIMQYMPYVISAAAAAAAVLPPAQEGTIWFTVRKVIDFLAINFGNAKNMKS
jgi:hypothetical protein